jgi:hypothetical protein
MSQGKAVSEAVAAVAYDALNLAKQTARDIEQHEDICAERYAGIHTQIGDIKKLIGWGGGLALTTVLCVLGFLAAAQFNSNDQARRDQQTKIEALQQQLLDERRASR